MLSINECKAIYLLSVEEQACKGNIEAAKRYLDAGDVEGFERVCRGNVDWLKRKSISYILTPGMAENWYDNGFLRRRGFYVNGKVEGVIETWHENGVLRCKYSGIDDKAEGLYEEWNSDGYLVKTRTYLNGAIQN